MPQWSHDRPPRLHIKITGTSRCTDELNKETEPRQIYPDGSESVNLNPYRWQQSAAAAAAWTIRSGKGL